MVAKVTVHPYQCEVCSKTYATEKQAEKCEQSHEETKQEQAKEQANRMKLHDRLVEIRNTAESWQELQDKALVELKAHYGDDFVLVLPQNYTGWHGYPTGASCTYGITKPIKKNDYFNRWGSGREVDASAILGVLGFTTHSGGGDGKVYSYGVSWSKENFKAINAKMLERQRAVEDAALDIQRNAKDVKRKICSDDKYKQFVSNATEIEEQIEKLQEQLQDVIAKKQQYIKENYQDQYKADAQVIINALPQQFKREYRDPCALEWFGDY